MSVVRLNNFFKIILIILGLIGIALLLVVAPLAGDYLPDDISSKLIQLLFWLTSIPVFAILINLWQISSDFFKNNIFKEKNHRRLIRIAYSGMIESLLYGIAIIFGFFKFQDNYPYFFICLFFFFLGIMLAVISTLLAYVFKLGNQLKDENDLTI
ncbi:DUF2975 domain-containing protein [Vagococcus carniphilus]|uniref:DUF2975 domain-containing protein n=1 Tax=Vagococcus carniphilus TaxID=218144 RepID=A0AAW8U7R2_9ENTE|nr:DUF2975 domain-containing protein [Vagococcus carniphilus]MDT2814099.1 DUF2975 domain-containing protein [Vagococcus carniphilus]MDT2830338.1 DUF2975 domain-containing protein [Vagococcus carniphilus]MDT2834259.1 DUF2975 domain-containing protein [Vagococcus carniphilus]MDT2840093.1 DUF2975 domain-containing protein [Vagococcus carniphilus]MDT2847918.1 DUF2975 domain-containing protein [Vagococcus carniphilus]